MSVNTQRLAYQLGQRDLTLPTQITKRDGSTVSFDIKRIEKAVQGCYGDFPDDAQPKTPVDQVVQAVATSLASRFGDSTPTVEQVQDMVEVGLLTLGEVDAARSYMAYRTEHALDRQIVPSDIKDIFDTSALYFPLPIQQFQFFDKYARFNWDVMHRETWVETVDRVVDYLRWLVKEYAANDMDESVWARIHSFILDQKSMPSMRALAMAGEPAKRNSLAIYNCSYMPVKDIQVFAEALLVSMAGCGVGYSVERQYVEQFPRIKRQTGTKTTYKIEDTTEGWAAAVQTAVYAWFAGNDVDFDYSSIRKAGTPLKVKGGRASGPEPLRAAIDAMRAIVLKRQGSFLRTIDAHDMMCWIGSAAVAGGVRRTAMIALFSWDDAEMRDCKNGAWGTWPAIRENANNSAVWPDGLSQVEVIDQMMEMVRGNRGEPGIFSRENANRTKPERRAEAEFGTNPCGEINLRPFGLCNLTIAVARPEDTMQDLAEKVEIATIIGTIQSLAVNFPGMREEWKQNCIEERLLGVDITGQRDCYLLNDPQEAVQVRERLKYLAIEVNKVYADMFGIARSASITCDKPSGNSSQLLNTSSGIHARWAPYYLRRTRVSATSALFRVLKAAGVPMTPENGQTEATATTWVIAWPMKAPDGAKTRKDFSVIEQCNYWLLNKNHWTEHNPSVTITYTPDEVLPMIQWVWTHRDKIGGMAFLPADDASYAQAPYEEVTQEEYEHAVKHFPQDIDFSLLYAFEHSDMTTAASELACMAGNCDV